MTQDSPDTQDRLFFDGDCGLSHSSVRFVIKRDRLQKFRYAPLSGLTFEPFRARLQRESAGEEAPLPDSIVVATAKGDLLLRSDAVAYILDSLGGMWRILGFTLRLIPRPIRDFVYDCVAKIRHRLFRTPTDICPIPPGDQRALFDP